MKRWRVISALLAAWALPVVAWAQPAKMNTILWVSTEAQPDPFIEGFREGMVQRGYVEGRNLAFILRYAPGSPAGVQAMMPELQKTSAELIFSSGPAIRGLRVITDRPVLFVISGDPVSIGLAESLARPGRNFTGMTFLSLEVAQKRVQLLREVLPTLKTLAVLADTTHPGELDEREATLKAATALGVRMVHVPFASAGELDGALERLKAVNADAMLVFPDGVTLVNREKVAAFARANRLPSMFGWREYCDVGGLACYGGNQRATYRRLAIYADRLLKGDKPADLPIEQPTQIELVINAATARSLGLTLPPAFVVRADAVIE